MQSAWLDRAASELIADDSVRWGPRETGGPLFGYESCGEIVITRAFLPGSKASHLPWLYRPDRAAVETAIEKMYCETQGRQRWIGSWHSHPLGRARPSMIDQRTARRISAQKAVCCPCPVMLIQTTRLSRGRICPAGLGSFRWSVKEAALVSIAVKVSS
jgi:integrative and conjugative element protein (TIGR02256 family)